MTGKLLKSRTPLLFLALFIFIAGGLWSAWTTQAQDGLLPLPGSAANRAFTEVQQLTASDGSANQYFGYHLELDGDVLVESSYFADGGIGAVHIFERSGGTWSEVDKVTGGDTAPADYFGYDVALEGNTFVAGAPQHDPNTDDEGAVYIFTRSSAGEWAVFQKLTVNGLLANSFLGTNVAINGDRIAVSAQGNNKVYIFKQNPANQFWSLETDIDLGFAPYDVALDGNKLLIGTATEANASGAAYLYQFQAGSWVFIKKMVASDGAFNDLFGYELELQDDEAFIFSFSASEPNPNRGTVYVYTENGGEWNETQKLNAADVAANDYFGHGLAVDGQKMAISSYGDSSSAGSVYLFGWNGSAWVQEDKIPSIGGAFGFSIDLDQEVLVSSAPYADVNQGRVYVYNDPNLLPTPTPTITAPTTELLSDGSFESDAAGWEVKDATGDKVKCNKEGKVIAHTGNCAWQFKGGDGENSKIQQTITSGATPGGSITLSGFVNAKGAVNSKIKIVVAYLNPSIPKSKISVDVSGETAGSYIPLSTFQTALSTDVVAPFEKIKVQVKNSSTSGKVYYDELSLTAQ
jgi:hypothetical protein